MRAFVLFSTLAMLLDTTCSSETFFTVLPGGSQSIEGNSATSYPFNGGNLGFSSMRYQQVFWQDEFITVITVRTNPLLIDQIYFRLDSAAGPSPPASIDVEVHLSTTPRAVDGLSPIFAENIGADDIAVIPRSSQPMNPAWISGMAPQSLHLWNLSTPFYYDPTQGNLLLDIRVYNPVFTAPFDAVNRPDDDVSRVWASSVLANSGTVDSIGLVTGFYATVVPEPSTTALLLCGAGVLGFLIRRQTHRKP
jgi:hypothetical protein